MPTGVYKRTEYHRKRLSESHKGKKFSPEWRENISKARIGRPNGRLGSKHTEETKRKMRATAITNGNKPPGFLGKKFTKEHKKKLSQSHKGKIGPLASNWQGGITPIHKRIRNSEEYKAWRHKVFIKDDYTCKVCYKRGGYLHAHHIKSFAWYPELRFELSNGLTLCVLCHRQSLRKLKSS